MDYLAAALWSINERLAGQPGTELPPLHQRWVADVIEVAAVQSAHVKELLDEAEEESLRLEARSHGGRPGGDW